MNAGGWCGDGHHVRTGSRTVRHRRRHPVDGSEQAHCVQAAASAMPIARSRARHEPWARHPLARLASRQAAGHKAGHGGDTTASRTTYVTAAAMTCRGWNGCAGLLQHQRKQAAACAKSEGTNERCACVRACVPLLQSRCRNCTSRTHGRTSRGSNTPFRREPIGAQPRAARS